MATKQTAHTWYPPPMKNAEKRRARLERIARTGMSQTEIAQRLGVDQTAVGRWLRGDRLPTPRHWDAIDSLAIELGNGAAEAADPADPYTIHVRTIPNTPELRAVLLAAMAERDWSFGRLSRAAGYDSPNTVRRLLVNGDLHFFPSMLAALAHAVAVEIVDLPIADDAKCALLSLGPALAHARQVRDIPIVADANAAELTVVNGVLDFPNWEDADKVPNPTDGRRCFAFRVHGRSMFPKLDDGDIVLVDTDLDPTPGRIAVVILDDDSILIKIWRPLGDQVLLQSLNTEGEDRVVKPQQVKWAKQAIRKWGDL